MIDYPPTRELYLGCECWDLDHVALFIHFPPRIDRGKSVIEDPDDPPVIYFHVTTRNYYTQLFPSIRYFYEKYTWQEFSAYNWYQRLWIAGRYIFNPAYHMRWGILDAFDFQEKDYDKLDAFLALISSDIDDDIDDKSELWLDDERWAIKFQPTRFVSKKFDFIEPWKIGWEPHFMQRGFWGRIHYAFKYIFGRHGPEKSFALYKKDATKIRGMIKWVKETNKKDEKLATDIQKIMNQ